MTKHATIVDKINKSKRQRRVRGGKRKKQPARRRRGGVG